MKLDKEEKDLIKSIESGKWSTVKGFEDYKKHLRDTARKTMLKDRRMNLRISSRDLNRLKARALEEGMPYQTLISSILHKYVNGKLKESGI